MKMQKYCKTITFNVEEIEPAVAKPHTVDNHCSISEVEGLAIDQALIGTCTNGRFTDLQAAARVLKGKKSKSKNPYYSCIC